MPEGRELSGYEVEQAFSVLSSIDVGALSVGAGGSHMGVTIPVTAPHTVSPAGTLEAAATAFASVASGRTGKNLAPASIVLLLRVVCGPCSHAHISIPAAPCLVAVAMPANTTT